jgi:hypothetical protein
MEPSKVDDRHYGEAIDVTLNKYIKGEMQLKK